LKNYKKIRFLWKPEKDRWLREERGIGFEDIEKAVAQASKFLEVNRE